MTNTVITTIKVGPTKYMSQPANLAITRYANNGNIALMLLADDGEPQMKCTINRDGTVPDNIVVVKDYAENEGMLNAAIAAGIVIPIREYTVPNSYVCLITDLLSKEIELVTPRETK